MWEDQCWGWCSGQGWSLEMGNIRIVVKKSCGMCWGTHWESRLPQCNGICAGACVRWCKGRESDLWWDVDGWLVVGDPSKYLPLIPKEEPKMMVMHRESYHRVQRWCRWSCPPIKCRCQYLVVTRRLGPSIWPLGISWRMSEDKCQRTQRSSLATYLCLGWSVSRRKVDLSKDIAYFTMRCLCCCIHWLRLVIRERPWFAPMDACVESTQFWLPMLPTFLSSVWWVAIRRATALSVWLNQKIEECACHSMVDTLKMLRQKWRNKQSSKFDMKGLHPVYTPFWKDLPFTNIFACITPDILHQLHKGIFHDHLVQWCLGVVGEKEMHACFQGISQYPGLRHFKKGISMVSQWTGTEHKQMERVFVGLLSSAAEDNLLMTARSLLDFIYYAQFQQHTDKTLMAMQDSLSLFHVNKGVLIELRIREHFNVPKIHSLMHYVSSIWALGSADGYNMEYPERLHINYTKDAYWASNKHDYIEQMALWLQCQEAIHHKTIYHTWKQLKKSASVDAIHASSGGGIDSSDWFWGGWGWWRRDRSAIRYVVFPAPVVVIEPGGCTSESSLQSGQIPFPAWSVHSAVTKWLQSARVPCGTQAISELLCNLRQCGISCGIRSIWCIQSLICWK